MSDSVPPSPEQAGGPAVPTCYRHPGRETYIRCARCSRPICPDCMIDAAVGFQCPECVAEGRASVRAPRTPGGGAVTGSPALVTRLLVGLMVVLFVVQQAVGDVQVIDDFALQPLRIADGELYRLVTAAFLHASVTHLMFNMLALFLLGSPLEAWFGRLRYVVVYGLALLGGSVASYWFTDEFTFAVGASGAIFGLMGATYVVALRRRWDVRPVTVLIVLNLAIGFLVPNIDWRAHLGGLVVGSLVAAALAFAPRAHRTSVLVATVVVGLVAAGAAVAVRTAELEPLARVVVG